MILKTVKLLPFGAARDKEYAFQSGLNVLLGPNEAGKSTLVNAVFAALFLSPDLRKNSTDWKDYLVKFLPYPGGDTARVSIAFESEDGRCCDYTCAWGERREARLILDNGAEINNPDEIRLRLQEALRLGRGTYEAVLMARQAEMVQTVQKLQEHGEASRTLAELLRRSLFESGGVSLEALEASIMAEKDRLLQNWDPDRDGPRGGRGIDNRHKQKIGAVLDEYYELEELQRLLRDTRDAEKRVAELAVKLEKAAAEQSQAEHRKQELELVEDDVRRRAVLQPQLDLLAVKQKELKAVISEWPRVEERLKNLQSRGENERNRLSALEAELQQAKLALSALENRLLFGKALPLQRQIEQRQTELAGLASVARVDLDFLERKQQEAATLKSTIEAMKLKAFFHASRPLTLKVTSGLKQPVERTVENDAAFEGAGRLLLEGPDWTLDVQSGEGDAAGLLEQLRQAGNACETKLAVLGLQSIDEARVACAARDDLEKNMGTLRGRLDVLLGEFSFSELEQAVAALGPDQPARDPELIREEISALKISLNSVQLQLEQEQEKLNRWESEHQSLDKILDAMAELRREAKEIEGQLEHLAPLPEHYDTAEAYMTDLRSLREKHEQLRNEIFSCKEHIARAAAEIPEESSEEISARLKLSRELLAQLKEQARAVRVVEHEFNELKNELDRDTYEPLARAFERYLRPLTNHRYTAASMTGVIPLGITPAEGEPLPVELLSTGTAGGAALALRLAMAEFLLQEATGFMIMDDPLVDLDPERKEQAAAVLREFARERQLIITTCDPVTAGLLGGHRVEMCK